MKIRFQDREWLLVGDLESGGAIATDEDFVLGRASYAHLFSDGEILRYGLAIGSVSDIEVIDEHYQPEPTPATMLGCMLDESWDIASAIRDRNVAALAKGDATEAGEGL